MTTTIITKNSSTASAVPLAGSLVQGELAVNVTDKKLYTKDSSATVVKVVGSLGNQEANAVAITGGTVAGVAQTGGTINNTPIGATTASTVRGTTVTATTGFSGDLTGNVTGNTTGTHTGAVTGNVTGNLTGNVTAASGTSTFNHVTISGSLDMDAGTTATITGLATPVNNTDAATKIYVDTAISNLVDGAPANLDTLNEIAAALNDDANLAATLTASIATKVSKAGDSMTGALAMGNNKITGLGTPTAGTDATTKTYVDTADALKLNLSGGTMTGNIVMGANKVTSTATPTVDDDLTRKGYVDSILGSATSAAASASAAATSATNAANSASASADSATASAASASSAAASYDSFDDRYLGAKASAPSVDNDGNALLTGALYWNSTSNELYLWTGSSWTRSALTGSDYVAKAGDTMTGALTTTGLTLSGGTANGVAYLNGSKVLTTGSALTFDGTTLTASNSAATAGNFKATSTTAQVLNVTASNDANTTVGLLVLGSAAGSIGMLGAGAPALYTAATELNLMANNASGVIKFAAGGSAERMRLDSSGNLGLGVTPSAWGSGRKILQMTNGAAFGDYSGFTGLSQNYYQDGSQDRYIANGFATRYLQGTGQHLWYTAPSGTAGNAISFTQAMTLDASGNLAVGLTPTNGYGKLQALSSGTVLPTSDSNVPAGYSYAQFSANSGAVSDWLLLRGPYGTAGHKTGILLQDTFYDNTAYGGRYIQANGQAITFGTMFNGTLYSSNGTLTEHARIDSSGNLLVGTTSAPANRGALIVRRSTTATTIGNFFNDSSDPYGVLVNYSAAAPNDTSHSFFYGADNAANRFFVYSNGGIANYSGNNVNLSDRREKTNFAPAKSYLETICAIPVQTFNYADQNMGEDPGLTLGVVAQDVQAVAPELVMESNWGTKDEPKMRLSIYQTDLQYALMKALQELKAEFDAYKATHP